MSVKPSVIIALAVSGFVTFGALSHPSEGPGQHIRWLSNALQLSDAQKQDLRILMKQKRQDTELYREDLQAMRHDLRALISVDSFEPDMVAATIERYRPVLQDMAEQRFAHMQQIVSLLSAQQRDKMLELGEQRVEGDFPARFEKKKARMLARLVKKLELEENQQEARTAIADALEKRWLVHHVKRDFFHGLLEAQLEETLDDNSFDLAFEQFYDDLVQSSTEAVVAAQAVLPLLTEEQQATFIKFLNKGPRHKR